MFLKLLKKNARDFPQKKKFIYDAESLNNRELYLKVQSTLYFFREKKIVNKRILVEYTEPLYIIPLLLASIIINNHVCLIDLRIMKKSKPFIEKTFCADICIFEKDVIIDEKKISLEQVYKYKEHSKFDFAFEDIVEKEKLVLTIFTSGSTGIPKGINFKKSSILFCIESILKKVQIDSLDKIGLFLPLTFDYGLYHIFFALFSDCTLEFFTKDFSEFGLLNFISQQKITFLPSLPKITMNLFFLVKKNGSKGLESLKTITNTGEFLDFKSQKIAWEINPELNIYFMYGITECKRVSILTPDEFKEKKGSVGKPIPGVEVFLVNENILKLKKKGFGELVVKGPNVAEGYLNNNSDQSFFEIENKNYFRTGDLFFIDKDGYLFFKGRISGFMKINGYRVDPLEIEKSTMKINEIVAVKVLIVHENVIMVYQGSLSKNNLYKKLIKILDDYKIPKLYKMKEMPLSNNGKIDIDSIREILKAKLFL
ncbi:hypothetical protein DOK67_0000689 [Enterococcus sp. DIV0212c]|uniref:ANL family adenylate-forming protein n=1 Tax=Enterococcus sp. DIV0212c TaxID=2230867 RepID=UPI001A9BFFA6|nr:fatty acid--CoA ligase family protein [Enterococcus sp. DIV0212c]MBO1354660.1 long-chain fatty acid--CoA ligase [Enterococcus sp. DIV0212c]